MNWKKWVVRVASGRGRGFNAVLGRVGGCTGPSCGAPVGTGAARKSLREWVQRILGARGNSMTTQNTQAVKLLDEVLGKLGAVVEGRLDGAVLGGGNKLLDAIDREVAAAPRQTAVQTLRQSEVLEQFRRELETQSLTVATVTSFLQILQQVLPLLLVK